MILGNRTKKLDVAIENVGSQTVPIFVVIVPMSAMKGSVASFPPIFFLGEGGGAKHSPPGHASYVMVIMSHHHFLTNSENHLRSY